MKHFVLQSGFSTREATKLVRSEEVEMGFKDSLYAASRRPGDTENYYDEEVEKLFQLWRKDDSIMRRFEFREEVLQAAIRLFSGRTGSIVDWIELQLKQRSVGYLHRRYIKEVLASAVNNTQKTADNYTYYRLLKAGGNDELVQTSKDDSNRVLTDFVKSGSNTKVSYILSCWTNDIRGFGDLLHTLHVIFGRRSDTSAITGNTGVRP